MPNRFENLPPLTPDQANAVVAMLCADGSLASIATNAGFTLGAFLDLVESPEVTAHLAAARRAATSRAHQRLAEAAHGAAEVLEAIAQDDGCDKIERRRAASTILRTLRPMSRRRPPDRAASSDHVEPMTRLVAHADRSRREPTEPEAPRQDHENADAPAHARQRTPTPRAADTNPPAPLNERLEQPRPTRHERAPPLPA